MDEIAEYYARIERERLAAADIVQSVEDLMAEKRYGDALNVAKPHLSPAFFESVLLRYSDIANSAQAALEKLRKLAHEAGNTGD